MSIFSIKYDINVEQMFYFLQNKHNKIKKTCYKAVLSSATPNFKIDTSYAIFVTVKSSLS